MSKRILFCLLVIGLVGVPASNAVKDACGQSCEEKCTEECKSYGFSVHSWHPCECVDMSDGGTCRPDGVCTGTTGGNQPAPNVTAGIPRFRLDVLQSGGFEGVAQDMDWPFGATGEVRDASVSQFGLGVVYPISGRFSLDVGLQRGSGELRRGMRFGEERVESTVEMDVEVWDASVLGRIDLTDGGRVQPWLSAGLRSIYLDPGAARVTGRVSGSLGEMEGSESRNLLVAGGGVDVPLWRSTGISAFANYGLELGWRAGLSITTGLRTGDSGGRCAALRSERDAKRRSAAVLSERASVLRHAALTARNLGGPATLRERARQREAEAGARPGPEGEALLAEANEFREVASRLSAEGVTDADVVGSAARLVRETDALEGRVEGLLMEVSALDEEIGRRCPGW